jgi:hypothetical protein
MRIMPDIAAVSPEAAELHVVAMGSVPGLEDEDKLVLAPV